jgi:hypothetical protein
MKPLTCRDEQVIAKIVSLAEQSEKLSVCAGHFPGCLRALLNLSTNLACHANSLAATYLEEHSNA